MAIDKIQLYYTCNECSETFTLLYSSEIVRDYEDMMIVINGTTCYCCGSKNIKIIDIKYLDSLLRKTIPVKEEVKKYFKQDSHVFNKDFLRSTYKTGKSSWDDLKMEDLQKTMDDIDRHVRERLDDSNFVCLDEPEDEKLKTLGRKIFYAICIFVAIMTTVGLVGRCTSEKPEEKPAIIDPWDGQTWEEEDKEW